MRARLFVLTSIKQQYCVIVIFLMKKFGNILQSKNKFDNN